MFSVILAALDSAHQKPVSKGISMYYMAHEVASTFLALLLLEDALDWRFLTHCSASEFAQWLRRVVLHMRLGTLKLAGDQKPSQISA
ncbi:MAG: hypothetical protein PHE55_20095 [Methylococcaceae bacterium]|nr:hypothetical protein [Methylococcaceae bacterium]